VRRNSAPNRAPRFVREAESANLWVARIGRYQALSHPGRRSIRLQDRHLAADRGPEDSTIQVQNLDYLTFHMIDKRLCRRVTRRDDPGCFDHASKKALVATRLRLLRSAPIRDFAHGHANQHQRTVVSISARSMITNVRYGAVRKKSNQTALDSAAKTLPDGSRSMPLPPPTRPAPEPRSCSPESFGASTSMLTPATAPGRPSQGLIPGDGFPSPLAPCPHRTPTQTASQRVNAWDCRHRSAYAAPPRKARVKIRPRAVKKP
jgi:hypothetical protein